MPRFRYIYQSVLIAVALVPLFPARAQQAPAATEIGVEQRVRNEDWNNLFDFSGSANDEREQIRFRTRVWAKIPVGNFLEVQAGLNSETNYKVGQTNRFDEVGFETANITFRRLGIKGLTLKVGRQDLMKGEGLLLFEGTPGDGSRTMYFNAANLAYSFRKSNIEAIGILNPRTDRFLPIYHDQNKTLIEWDEQALGLYYTDNNISNTTWESYYFHKKETGDRRALSNPQHQFDRRIETAGGRLNRKLSASWTVTGEFARQWGKQANGLPIGAWAAYGYATHSFHHALKPYLTAGYWALSGDDPGQTGKIAGWDPLFSRWPKWGDLELYSEAGEKGVGYATNQKRLQLEAGFTPLKNTTMKLIYYKVGAFHPFTGKPSVFGKGTDRGQDLQARMDFQLNKSLRGHVDFESMAPGDFYAGNGRAYFLRFEMIAQAKTLLGAALRK